MVLFYFFVRWLKLTIFGQEKNLLKAHLLYRVGPESATKDGTSVVLNENSGHSNSSDVQKIWEGLRAGIKQIVVETLQYNCLIISKSDSWGLSEHC